MNAAPVSEADIAAFERDGAVCLRGRFRGDWLARLAAGAEAVMTRPGALASEYTPRGGPGRFFGELVLWTRIPQFRAFVLDSPAGEIAGRLMRASTANFYHDHLLVKEPGTAEITPWHHDQPYHPVDGAQLCALWLALDPVERECGVEFVKGSQLWGRRFIPRYFEDGRDYYEAVGGMESVPDIGAERERHEILSWALEPGDCIVFGARTLHGAPGNPTRARRRAYVTRWMGDDVTYAERPGLISPPIEGHGLAPGDAMDCETFPRVWSRTATDVRS